MYNKTKGQKMVMEQIEQGLSEKAYFSATIKKELAISSIIRIISSSLILVGIGGAIYSIFPFLSNRMLWPMIVSISVFVIGFILIFFPRSFKKKAMSSAKADFDDYYKDFKEFGPIQLQSLNRSFAFINKNNELEIHQDLKQIYLIPIAGIEKASLDNSKPKKKEKAGKYPYTSNLIVQMMDGINYTVKITNLFRTESMYTLESSNKDIKDLYQYNQKTISTIVDLIYAKKKEISPLPSEAEKAIKSISIPLKHVATNEVIISQSEKKNTLS